MVNESDVEQAILDGDGARIANLATDDPIFTLGYLDGEVRGLIHGPLPAAKLEWLMKLEVLLRRWLRFNEAKTGKTERELDSAIMRAAYRNGNLFLVAGAGLSMGEAGLVGWKDLVIEVLTTAIDLGSAAQRSKVADGIRNTLSFAPATAEEEVEKALADLIPINAECRLKIEKLLQQFSAQTAYNSDDLLQATELAKHCLGDRYFNQLQGILYFAHQLKTTETHKAIAAMVQTQKPRLSAILTYNFDDLLEKAVTNAGRGFRARCSKQGNWISHNGFKEGQPVAIDIYHVHGYVPGQMQFPKDIDLVFSAKEYEQAYGKANSITQSVNQAFLGNNALGLVLGSSLTDTYAVQQLQTLHAQHPGWYHYVMMKLPDEHPREYYRAMGLRVIWFDKYEEIPQLLREIAEL